VIEVNDGDVLFELMLDEPDPDDLGPASDEWIMKVAGTVPKDLLAEMITNIEKEIVGNDGSDTISTDLRYIMAMTKRRLKKALSVQVHI